MANELDIFLRFILDKATQSQTQAGVKGLAKDLKDFEGSFPGDALGADFQKFTRSLGDIEKTARKTSASLRAEAKLLSAQVAEMINGVKQAQISAIKGVSAQVDSLSRSSLATGVALTGGILAFATKYVNDSKVATATTIAWKKAQDDLNKSGQRFGAVLADEALPLLEKAARLADRASSFIEKNPQIVQAALNSGLVLASLGAVGIAVTKGIKLYTDVQYLASIPVQLAAAKLQDTAAEKQLQAALLRAKEFGVSVPGASASTPTSTGAGGLAGAATSVGLVVAGVIAAKYAVDLVNIVLQKTGISKSIADAQQKILETSKRPYPGIIAAARPGATSGSATTSPDLTGAALSPQFDAVLKAYEQYKQDDLSAVKKHYEDRKKIMADAMASEQRANVQYAANVAKVRSQTSSALSSAAKDLQAANEKAEIDFQTNRAQIIRDGNQEVEQLQKDLQEQLRKSQKEHQERAADLTASRDALGLAKENKRFQDEQSEAKREARQEIAQRRADTAQKLADLQQSYEQERAQRLADYEARRAEILAQQRQQLAELQAQHVAELREIQQAKIARIKELDEGYNEERKRRYQQLVQNIRDLDASLLGEKGLRDKYQAAMLSDLDRFLASYKSKLGSLAAAVPGKADGGYTAGLVRTGERGYEYVMTHKTTRAAEAMIGGRLTQQSLMAALAGSGSRQSVTWNDQRRFSGEYTNAIRRANQRDTLELLGGLFS